MTRSHFALLLLFLVPSFAVAASCSSLGESACLAEGDCSANYEDYPQEDCDPYAEDEEGCGSVGYCQQLYEGESCAVLDQSTCETTEGCTPQYESDTCAAYEDQSSCESGSCTWDEGCTGETFYGCGGTYGEQTFVGCSAVGSYYVDCTGEYCEDTVVYVYLGATSTASSTASYYIATGLFGPLAIQFMIPLVLIAIAYKGIRMALK